MNQLAEKKRTRPKLWQMHFFDHKVGVHLTTYADTLVYDSENGKHIIAAIRFGGYPEHVRGMADAIYAGGEVKIEKEDGGEMIFESLTKQYRRMLTNDDIYPEATLLVEDDRIKAVETQRDVKKGENSSAEQRKTDEIPRTSYIFCEQDNMERLFEEIDKKVSVPLIPEFKDYLILELQRRKILKKLTVLSLREKFDAWKIKLTKDETNVTAIIEDGLRNGAISIPGGTTENPFEDINTVSNYLSAFGVMIAEKIKGQFNPLFDPSTETLSREVMSVNENIKKNAGYYLYDAQLAEAEAIKRQLDRRKFGFNVAECGSGKTKIGATALCAHQTGKKKSKTFNVVLCPSHLSKKWVREIEESLPNTFAIHVKNITEINKVYDAYLKDNKSCYVVITKEKARDGYMRRPAVIWNKRKRAFLCPECHKRIMMDIFDEGVKYRVEADHFYFQKENKKNHKCEECGGNLWTALNPYEQSEWVKISNYGFVHRKHAWMHQITLRRKVVRAYSKREEQLQKEKRIEEFLKKDGCSMDADLTENTDSSAKAADEAVNDENSATGRTNDEPYGDGDEYVDGKKIEFPKTYYDIKDVVKNPDGHFQAAGAYVRYALSTYIKRKMRGRIDGLIVDEIQDYALDSGQGDAMNEIFGCAKKVVGLTGTLINGYSHGIFYLLYRVAPNLMQIDDKPYNATKEFNDEYGVTESIYDVQEAEYNSNRRTVKVKIGERQLPGVSPLVYSRFLIDSTAFLSLNDMGKDLPEYEEIPIELKMTDEVAEEYKLIEKEFTKILKEDKKIAKKVTSAFMGLLTVYPDQPYDMKTIINPITGATLIEPKDVSSFDVLNEKDIWVLEKVKEKVKNGERVIVYTSWIRIDTQKKLLKLFDEHNIRADALTAKVPPVRRESWVEKRVKDGIQVLITNPSLVETGLDLNDFTTLIYYNIGYKLFTLRQSSRRSWRINQKAPRIEVYFLYFANVMQHRAIRLMASKLAVAGIIEGNFTDEGLSAMSECQDLTTLLAQELTLGIKNEVEDLGAVFKKMAILKPECEPIEGEAVEITELESEASAEAEPLRAEAEPQASDNVRSKVIVLNDTQSHQKTQNDTTIKESETSFLSVVKTSITQTKPVKKKVIVQCEGQISLFDYFNVASA